MNFPILNSVAPLKENIVTGNIDESIFSVENIEDSGFNAEEVESSTKKNLDEDLKNVWNVLNNIHKQQIHSELEWFEENKVATIKASNNSDVRFDWFEEDQKVDRKVASSKPFDHSLAENECFTEDSGIFKMSLNDGSLSRTCYVKNEIVEQSFLWNEGDFSSNAISEPWSVENRGQDLEDFRNLTENESSNESLACLSPPKSKRVYLPFNLQNLLCSKKIRRS